MNKKTYSYTNTDGNSSGILLYFPKYWITYSAQAGSYIESNIQYWSNNLISHNGSHIEYSTVTQTNSDGSCEVFLFSNSSISSKYRDFLDVFDPINEVDPERGEWSITSNPVVRNIVTPLVSMKAERGKLLKHQIYAAEASLPVKETIYTYDTTRVLPFSLYPVYVIRKFGEILVHTDNWRLIAKTEKENNGTASITRTETYTYNAKGQMSSVTTTSSNGTQEITRYTYPYDHSSEGGIFTTMLDKNLHGYPVSETRYIKENGVETLIGGKKYSYSLINGLIKPSALLKYNTETRNWENELRYTAYDSLGNLLESYNAVNVPTSYIWGYGGMYLVGKVENATRSNLPSDITATPLNGELPQQTAATLRNTNNRLLTTYQYNPLIGLSKITYPNGTTESFSYNSSGKLSNIYDHMGNKKGTTYYSPDNRQ
jgi:YD repeat-containing protein